MPLLSTRGAASARGFGFSGGIKSIPPVFITLLTDSTGGGASQNYNNVAFAITESSAGDLYVGWRPNRINVNSNEGQLVFSKLNSSGVLQFNKNFAPNAYPAILNGYTAWNNSAGNIVASGTSFTGGTYAGSFCTINPSGTILNGRYFDGVVNNAAVTSSGNVWVVLVKSFGDGGISLVNTNSSLTPSQAYSLYPTGGFQRDGYIAGIDSSGNLWATTFVGDYTNGPFYDLVRLTPGGSLTFWPCLSAFGGVGFYKGFVGQNYVYLPAGSKFGVVSLADPWNASTAVTVTGMSVSAITLDSSGNIYLAGSSGNFGVVAKCSPSYGVMWARKVSSSVAACGFNGISMSNDGNYLFVNGSANNGNSGFALTMKISTMGFGPGDYVVPSATTLNVTPTSVSLSAAAVSLSATGRESNTNIPSTTTSTTSGNTNGYQNFRYAS